jgi:hypothetical protein
MMNLKKHMMREGSFLLDTPFSSFDLFDDGFPEFDPLLSLKDDHVISCFTMNLGLIFEQN